MSNPESPATAGMHTSALDAAATTEETPENGLAGLKHWKHDLLAGVVVSLVSLPLSSGIAIASGAPPIYGLISSIIAGLVYPFLGGSYVTISGPAAGLAPALVAIMASLGGAGDAHAVGAGYHQLLVVIALVGIAQIILARLKLAKFAAVFPASVVEGMLAAIGVLIFVKAIPLAAGVTEPGHPHGFIEYLEHVPDWLATGVKPALFIGLLTTALMLAVSSKRARALKIFKVVPPHLWGVAVAIPLGMVLDLRAIDPALLISVPENPISGIHPPAFSEVFLDSSTWRAVGLGVLTLMLIDGVESLATAQAIDRIDPYRRTSDPDRVLQAMGVSNLVSSLVGGLTVIPGGVKSKTNIEAGGRTLWSNFVNAMMLLLFLFVAPGLISLIPTAALGAILLYTGWKMAHPMIARHILHVGPEQLALYGITLVATLLTDLLIGVAIGTALKLLLIVYYARRTGNPAKNTPARRLEIIRSMFRDPVKETVENNGVAVLEVNAPLVCFNAFWLREHLSRLGDGVTEVIIKVTDLATVIDHTACETVLGAERYIHGRPVTIEGLDDMARLGNERDSIHLQGERRLRLALR